jgi:hypothetical protein
VQGITLGLLFQYTRVGGTKLFFVKVVAKTLGCLFHFLGNFVVVFGQLIFYQYIGPVAFLGVLVVNQGIIERIHVTGSLPDGRMHKNSRVDADHVFVKQHHGVPPIFFQVILELHPILTVVVHGA